MKTEDLFSRYTAIIPDFKSFMEYVNKPLAPSFRINTLKAQRTQILDLLRDFKMQPLKFYGDGFFLAERAGLGHHFTHAIGLIYAQGIASMVPPVVLEPKPHEVILDLCASPGSKTTQIAQIMGNTGLLVANEINPGRLSKLLHNVKRCGLVNSVIVRLRGDRLARAFTDYFDRVLIDAPCSLEGTIRKSKRILDHWGVKNINRMAWIQKGLAVSGFRLLRPGGTMVYSTCTIAPEENEAVIDYLLKKFPEAEIIPICVPGLKLRGGVTNWLNQAFDARVKDCARILPQDNDTEPFFVAKIFKRGLNRERFGYLGKIEFREQIIESLKQQYGMAREPFRDHAVFLSHDTYYVSTPEVFAFMEIKAIRKGLEIGRIYDHQLKPDNDFAQLFMKDIRQGFYPAQEWQLKKFLNGENIPAPGIEPGFIVITYKNLPIGVGRSNGQEIKSEILRERRVAETTR